MWQDIYSQLSKTWLNVIQHKETCLDLLWLLLIFQLHLEVNTPSYSPSFGAEQDNKKLLWQKVNKSQCLGHGTLPDSVYSVVNIVF